MFACTFNLFPTNFQAISRIFWMAPPCAEQFRIVFLVLSGALGTEVNLVPAHESNRTYQIQLQIAFKKADVMLEVAQFGHRMECKHCLYLHCKFEQISWSCDSVQFRNQPLEINVTSHDTSSRSEIFQHFQVQTY